MLFSCLVLGFVVVVVLVLCGGGDFIVEFLFDFFVEFRVNDILYFIEVIVNWIYIVGVDNYNFCDLALFENVVDVQFKDVVFCSIEIILVSVVFFVQYFNVGYELLELVYIGQGFIIYLYEYDKVFGIIGDEVWNLDYYV